MMYVKELLFAPLFFLNFVFFILQLLPFFKDPYLFFSTDFGTALLLIYSVITLLLTGICFVISCVIVNDIRINLGIGLFGSLLCFLFFAIPINIIIALGVLLACVLTILSVQSTLNSYIAFAPNKLFSSPVKSFATIILLIFSIGFYQVMSKEIHTRGIQIPDALLELSSQLGSGLQQPSLDNQTQQNPITKDQIELLRKNPQLLQQYGLDPQTLDIIQTNEAVNPSSTIKALLKTQLETMLAPYAGIIPFVMSLLFFVTLKSFVSLLSFMIGPLLSLLFYIFEKTGYIHFTLETRQVKKLVV